MQILSSILRSDISVNVHIICIVYTQCKYISHVEYTRVTRTYILVEQIYYDFVFAQRIFFVSIHETRVVHTQCKLLAHGAYIYIYTYTYIHIYISIYIYAPCVQLTFFFAHVYHTNINCISCTRKMIHEL